MSTWTLLAHGSAIAPYALPATVGPLDTTGAATITAVSQTGAEPSSDALSDSNQNVWVKRVTQQWPGQPVYLTLWDCIAPIAGPGHTFSLGGTAPIILTVLVHASGGDLVSYDGAPATGYMNNLSTQPLGPLTTGSDADLLVSVCDSWQGGAWTPAVDEGLTIADDYNNGPRILAAWGTQASAGPITVTWSFDGNTPNTVGVLVAYRGTPPPPPPPAVTAQLEIQTVPGWYRTTTFVPYNRDGTAGQPQTVGPLQASNPNPGPAHPPQTLAVVATYSDGFDVTWDDQGDNAVGEVARLWIDGRIVASAIAMGTQAGSARGLTPGMHAIGVDHFLNGQSAPAAGPIVVTASTAAPAGPAISSASQAEQDTNYPLCDGWFTVRVSWSVTDCSDDLYRLNVWLLNSLGQRVALAAAGVLPSAGFWDHQTVGLYDDGAHTPTTYRRYDVGIIRIADGAELAHQESAAASYHLAPCIAQ